MRALSVVGIPVSSRSKPWLSEAGYAPSTDESASPANSASPLSESVSSQIGPSAMSHCPAVPPSARESWQQVQPLAATCSVIHDSSAMNAASDSRGSSGCGTLAGGAGQKGRCVRTTSQAP